MTLLAFTAGTSIYLQWPLSRGIEPLAFDLVFFTGIGFALGWEIDSQESSTFLKKDAYSLIKFLVLLAAIPLATLYPGFPGKGQAPGEVWAFAEHDGTVFSIEASDDGHIYSMAEASGYYSQSASGDASIHKIDSDGNEVWSFFAEGVSASCGR